MLYRYGLCIIICTAIWIVNGRWLAHGIRARITSEIYMHIGLGMYFTLLAVELTLGPLGLSLDISWAQIVGFILYLPSAYLVVAGMRALKQKGYPEAGDPTATTAFIHTGIYGVIRQPITLGMFIWTIALVLIFQSILSIILGLPSMFCFWMSARKEAEYDIQKFGNEYKVYMRKVPIWNFLKGVLSKYEGSHDA
jgi:protein-S-isoprenylcysteine O-methyltransferase Ste14